METDFRHIPLGNDFAFAEVMKESDICRCFLETVLKIRIRELVYTDKQKDLTDSLLYHGIRLDVYVEDDKNTVYNIEMQNRLESLKRVRYYQSGIDRRMLKKNLDYTALGQTYIVCVCNFDQTGLKYPMYERTMQLECPAGNGLYDDGTHVVLLNAKFDEKYRNELPEICEYLELINQREEIDLSKYRYELAVKAADGLDRLRKDEAKGVAFMTFEQKIREEARYARAEGEKTGLEEGMRKGLQEGLEEGRREGRKEGRLKMREEDIRKLMERLSISREKAEELLS